jgi:hypothetical protein
MLVPHSFTGYWSDCVDDAGDKNDDPECCAVFESKKGISDDTGDSAAVLKDKNGASGDTASAASSLDGCTMGVVTLSWLERCNPPMVSKTALP